MAMTFRYVPLQRPDGALQKAPCIPVYEHDAHGRLLIIPAMVDSGADTTVVPADLAEVLRLPLGEEIATGGIGGTAKARKTFFSCIIKKGREHYSVRVPALILLDAPEDLPVLLGRNGFFEQFDITFRQSEEKIVLKKNAAAA